MNGQRQRVGAGLGVLLLALLMVLTACANPKSISPSTYSGEPDSATLTLRFQAMGGQEVDVITEESDTTVTVRATLRDLDAEPSQEQAELQVVVTLERALGARSVVDAEGRAIPQA